jgi:proteasome accessory factor A
VCGRPEWLASGRRGQADHRLYPGSAEGAGTLGFVERRIFGLENEYGVTCTFRGQRRLSPDEVARYLFRRVVHWGRSSNVFLENGARLYLDVGSHPEYATPECDRVLDLVAHDKAGERILEALLSAAEVRLHEEGISGDVYLFKNNTDSAGNSYGCHENYLVARQGEFSRMADVLIPFLVTRQVICGAGKVLHGPRGAVYCISQRAEHIWEGVSSATTRSRPIINTRDEPHADAERFRRLHVIVGDSNMSEFTTFLKVGITDLVVRMVEENNVMRDLTLENAIRAIREISHDITGKRKVRLATGRELTAVEIQREYFDKAVRFIDRRGGDEVTTRVLAEWGAALDALANQDLERLVTKIDWVAKHRLLESYREKHGLSLAHPRIALMDLAYHEVNRNRGLYYVLERRGKMERVVSEKDVSRAMREPPQTTRAKLRGEFIRQAKLKRRDYTVDWVHLKLNDQAQRTVLCKDPFRSVDERVEHLIAHM